MTKISSKSIGIAAGLTAAITYGMNPLFAVPLAGEGFSTENILFIRFSLSALLIGVLLILRKESFAVTRKELLLTIPAGLLFAMSANSLYLAYRKMDSGIASTLLFIYPFLTALIMRVLFKEKLAMLTIAAIVIASCGIVLLCRKADGTALSTTGILLVMLSALAYSVYMIWINRTALQTMPLYKFSFYSILTCAVFFAVPALFGDGHFGNFTVKANLCCLGIAVFPTVLSLVTTTISIQRVGATITSILGSLECVTAVCIGVAILGETMTLQIAFGILLILIAVILIALKKQ